VRIGPKLRMAAFASPSYVSTHGKPASPRELVHHLCINMRLIRDGSIYAWEFERPSGEIKIKVDGQLVLNRTSLIIKAALAGHGIGFLIEDAVRPMLSSGALIEVLEDWCQPFDGYHLYYPTRRQSSLAFRILIDAVRYRE